MIRETIDKINDEKRIFLNFRFENKNYKFEVEDILGRYHFSDKNEYKEKAPSEFLYTMSGTDMCEHSAKSMEFKKVFRRRGAENVSFTHEKR